MRALHASALAQSHTHDTIESLCCHHHQLRYISPCYHAGKCSCLFPWQLPSLVPIAAQGALWGGTPHAQQALHAGRAFGLRNYHSLRSSTAQRDPASTNGLQRWRYQGATASSPAQPHYAAHANPPAHAPPRPHWHHLHHNNQLLSAVPIKHTARMTRRRSWARQHPAPATHAILWSHSPRERQHT